MAADRRGAPRHVVLSAHCGTITGQGRYLARFFYSHTGVYYDSDARKRCFGVSCPIATTRQAVHFYRRDVWLCFNRRARGAHGQRRTGYHVGRSGDTSADQHQCGESRICQTSQEIGEPSPRTPGQDGRAFFYALAGTFSPILRRLAPLSCVVTGFPGILPPWNLPLYCEATRGAPRG